jgi:serine/threonine protein kinase/formylglycine-generating enzyme required for sulfatase activity
MGVVYLARNKLMDRLEVLKVLSKEMLAKQGRAERFLREIQSAAKLHHPNVVAAHMAFQMGELLVFAMEYVEGDDLAKLVRARGPLPVVNACYFAYQAAQGLQHAHERGMIHRDIKPGNLILSREGKKAVVKILDFGLAKVTSERGLDRTLTQEGQMLGTPDYIAPEQTLDAQKADIRADIYSLGCTLYHLLTGNTPFSGSSLFAVLQAHHSVEATPLNLVRPEVSVELAAVVAKMMAKDPNRRYQTPAEVVQALKPFLKPGGSTSPQPELFQAASPIDRPAPAVALAPTPDDDGPHLAPMEAVQPAERWKSLIDASLFDRSSAMRSAIRKRVRRQPSWMWPAVAVSALLLGVMTAWASGIFSVKTKDGVIVIENLPEHANVYVDGEVVTVRPVADSKDGEITVRAGNHRVEVKRGDVTVAGETVSIASGETKPLRIHLEPPLPAPSALPPTFKNSLGMEFVLVPKGKSWLGGGGGRPGDKEVQIAHDFYLGKYEVTQEQWEKVTGRNPSFFSRTGGHHDKVNDIADAELKRFPVENVKWEDAQAFLKRLNETEQDPGWVYRLPKEAEWEYACRGGPLLDQSESAYAFYLDKPTNQLLPEQADFEHGKGLKRTSKVGSYRPNRLGLYDMHGNVVEWCDDTEKTADGTARHVIRGGSWSYGSWNSRAASRILLQPGFWASDTGLRVARVPADNAPDKEHVKIAPVEKQPADADRRAAEWVVSLAGVVRVAVPRQGPVDVRAGGRLPAEKFKVRQINIYSKTVHDSDLALLEGLTQLRVLNAENNPVGDEGVAHLKGLTSLGDLNLARTRISDAGLAHLAGLTNLRRLFLWGNPQLSDAGLAHLKGLPNLNGLFLWFDRGVTDNGLAELEGMVSLTELDLNGTRLTDAGLMYLKGLTNLTYLNLMSTRISGAGFIHLKGLPNLRRLDFAYSTLGDFGMANLEGLTKLNHLRLDHTKVTDAGLVHLRGLPNLVDLFLRESEVSDAGLVHLKGLTKLRRVCLTNTRVSDAGLVHLKGMTHLAELDLSHTHVKAEGVAMLKASLPKCNIIW